MLMLFKIVLFQPSEDKPVKCWSIVMSDFIASSFLCESTFIKY